MKSSPAQKSASPPATNKRTRRTPEEARRLILDAAQQAIARTGPEGLRLQEIAAAAGISHPLILHHFGSRAGLVRALTREATLELRDKLVEAMTAGDFSVGAQLDRVFDAFRSGLAQRMAWLATVDPEGGHGGERGTNMMIQREIADHLHAKRSAAASSDPQPKREDTECLVHLIAVAALGDALFGAQLWRSAGIDEGVETDRDFRAWFAELLRGRSAR
jgi:TetR/AcrR family transcriptional regulator, repressor for neighboring sulfatase